MKTVFEQIDDDINVPGRIIEGLKDIPSPPPGGGILDVLKTPTGGGAVSSYLDHPLNFAKSEGLAQVIRGITGFLGDTAFAVVDVIFGLIRFAWERRAKNAP